MIVKVRQYPNGPGSSPGCLSYGWNIFFCWAFEAYKIKRESTNLRINGTGYNWPSLRPVHLRINVGAVPLCPPVRWLGGVRLFVYSSIRLFV